MFIKVTHMSEKKKGFNDFFASTLDSGIFLSQ